MVTTLNRLKPSKDSPFPDIADSEKFAMIVMAVFTILFGIMPWIALDMMHGWTVAFFENLLIPALGGGGV